MKVIVTDQAQRTQCYVCHKPTVDCVCHHCGRAICSDHRAPDRQVDSTSLKFEFTNLGLETPFQMQAGVHCKDCAQRFHTTKRSRWIAGIIILLGLLIMGLSINQNSAAIVASIVTQIASQFFGQDWQSYLLIPEIQIASSLRLPVPVHQVLTQSLLWVNSFRTNSALLIGTAIGILLILLGIIIWVFQTAQLRKKRRRGNQPPFPALPNIHSLRVEESMNGEIRLDSSGKYSTGVNELTGSLTIQQEFIDDDRNRLDRYCKKYRIRRRERIPLHAGFIVLEGTPNLKMQETNQSQVNTLPMVGTVGEHPFLVSKVKGGRQPPKRQWEYSWKYIIVQNNTKKFSLPIQIIPTFVPDGTKKAMSLVIQVSPDADISQSKVIVVKKLSLWVPNRLGNVEADPRPVVVPSVQIDAIDQEVSEIIWENIVVELDKLDRRSTDLYISFKNDIVPNAKNEIEQNPVLYGELWLDFVDWTSSGVRDISLFYPWGEKHKVDSIQRKTRLTITFGLHLASLLFPEPIRDERKFLNGKGVIPDYNFVIKLTKAINERGFYVKHIIENRPRSSKLGAHITNYFWDVAGRHYEEDEIYPIDFSLTITGEEAHNHLDQSKTQIEMTVQGIRTQEGMHKKVEKFRDELSAIIEATLAEASASGPTDTRNPESDQNT